MSDSRAATGLDRLPWLADEPKPKAAPAKRRAWDLLGWAAAAALLVAGASFWLGSWSQTPEALPTERPSTTAPLPHPTQQAPIAPLPQVAPVPVPEVRATPVPEVYVAPQRVMRPTRAGTARAAPIAAETSATSEPLQETATTESRPAPALAAAAPVAATPLRPWQPRVVAGAAGRLVEVGAFGSVQQAKRGWRHMVRSYPAVAHLPAVVRPDRNSKGRIFYRFRVGTTSQAHSEVLCQRMQRIRFSCAVMGLPWKAKVER